MARAFPRLRWAALAWLLVYLPSYALSYGLANFLFLCNIAVGLTCLGLWRGSALLLSSQALSSLIVDAFWVLDFLWRLLLGHHLYGGTEYMWDPRWPLATRVLSLYHFVLPPLLLRCLKRTGYDRRGYALQSAIALAAVAAARLFGPEVNINYAFRDPFFRRAWGPPAVHVAVIVGALLAGVYLPTHAALSRLYRPPRDAGGASGSA